MLAKQFSTQYKKKIFFSFPLRAKTDKIKFQKHCRLKPTSQITHLPKLDCASQKKVRRKKRTILVLLLLIYIYKMEARGGDFVCVFVWNFFNLLPCNKEKMKKKRVKSKTKMHKLRRATAGRQPAGCGFGRRTSNTLHFAWLPVGGVEKRGKGRKGKAWKKGPMRKSPIYK